MIKAMKYKLLFLAGLALLLSASACIDMTTIQHSYIADRDLCHKKADGLVGSYFTEYSEQPSEEDEEKVSSQVFCDCMKNDGWHVGTCPKPQKPALPPTSAPAPNQVPASNSVVPE